MLNFNFLKFKTFVILLSFFSACLATESIKNFDANIKIQNDGWIKVTEKITFNIEHAQIRRGIFRTIPTKYYDSLGNRFNVEFKVLKVLFDSEAIKYQKIDFLNGVKILIGDPSKLAPVGIHTYTIEYLINREIGFFDKFDELYWNVTGNDWKFTIENVNAKIEFEFANSLSKENLQAISYTGRKFSKNQRSSNQMVVEDPKGIIVNFKTLRPLFPNEGLTIAVNWPKGFITAPSKVTKIARFFKDNWQIPYLLLIFILSLIFLLYTIFFKIKPTQKSGIVIPLFEAPDHLDTAGVRYIYNKKYDSICFTAYLVDLAVKGFLKIEQLKGIFKNDYELIKVTNSSDQIFNTIFARGLEKIKISENSQIMTSANNLLQYNLDIPIKSEYLDYLEINKFRFVVVTSFLFYLALFFDFYLSPLAIVIAISQILLLMISYQYFYGYTQPGIKIRDQIAGFKMFLETTEYERLKIIGTPPTRTPETYEKFLPYAIALGVEQQWAQQFRPVFEKLSASGHAYAPNWYVGDFGPQFNIQPLASSISSSISSSSKIPGSSSGSSGNNGSSGSGGGGGGGGGW